MIHEIKLYKNLFDQIYKNGNDIELNPEIVEDKKICAFDLIFFHNEEDEYQVIKTKVLSIDSEKIKVRKLYLPYLMDGHMHLEYGPLSKEYVLEFVKEGHKKGLDEIDILDHTHRFKEFEGCYEHLKKYDEQARWLKQETKFCSTLDDYYQLIKEIREMDLPLKVKFGLEVCYTDNTEELLRKILKDVKLDFLTGAVHSFNSILYDMSFSDKLLWDVYECDEIYKDYYKAVYDCINSGLFDRLAHPDQIKMMKRYPSYDLHPTYEKIADALKQHDMSTESNTGSHFRYDHPDIGTNEEFLKILKERNVKIITASDAHKPSDVGNYILEAYKKIVEVV